MQKEAAKANEIQFWKYIVEEEQRSQHDKDRRETEAEDEIMYQPGDRLHVHLPSMQFNVEEQGTHLPRP